MNNGVSYALKEYLQRMVLPKTYGGIPNPLYYLKSTTCWCLDKFVNEDFVYKFDDSIKALNTQLQHRQQWIFWLMCFLVLVYWVLAIFSPLYVTYTKGKLNAKSSGYGVSYLSYYMFGAFACFTLVFEFWLFLTTLTQTSHLAPPIVLPGVIFLGQLAPGGGGKFEGGVLTKQRWVSF